MWFRSKFDIFIEETRGYSMVDSMMVDNVWDMNWDIKVRHYDCVRGVMHGLVDNGGYIMAMGIFAGG